MAIGAGERPNKRRGRGITHYAGASAHRAASPKGMGRGVSPLGYKAREESAKIHWSPVKVYFRDTP